MQGKDLSKDVITLSVKEFSIKWNLDYSITNSFIKGLEKAGIAVQTGKQKSGKGRDRILWSIPTSFSMEI